ncbi:UPF0481 protein At3g47200-like [Humulus lupulus]|uniref:UPF0481 protein At3g47200-like n=1 Tax=Humulus lupulus TaxID=3486 RepID=UPI002B416B57|nr:UPF0481 protein At3g47200-like [Humulus lupulus]
MGVHEFMESIPADQSHEAADQSSVAAISKNENVDSKIDEIDEKSRMVPAQKSSDDEEDEKPKPKPKIQKVPMVFRGRKNFDKYFEPRVVSIGPIHRGKPKLELWEKYKTEFTAEFVKNSKYSTRFFFNIIRENITSLKELFDEEVLQGYDDDDDTLSLMLVVDGCFILQFVYSINFFQRFNIKIDQLVFALNDLLLLENQIPFHVLELLMESLDESDERVMTATKLMASIKNFIVKNVMAPSECNTSLEPNFLQTTEDDKLVESPTHLLELLQFAVVQPVEQDPKSSKPIKDPKKSHSFRNVQELKAAGIGLKRGNDRKRWSLRKIKFSYKYGVKPLLELPRLMVDDSTVPKFMNLIAYEMCPDNFRTDYEVTSYACFMDSLIDHPNDVEELRLKKILVNLLGCDEEVTKVFNEIATDLVPDQEMYKDVKIHIQKQYDRKYMRWVSHLL